MVMVSTKMAIRMSMLLPISALASSAAFCASCGLTNTCFILYYR